MDGYKERDRPKRRRKQVVVNPHEVGEQGDGVSCLSEISDTHVIECYSGVRNVY